VAGYCEADDPVVSESVLLPVESARHGAHAPRSLARRQNDQPTGARLGQVRRQGEIGMRRPDRRREKAVEQRTLGLNRGIDGGRGGLGHGVGRAPL